MGIEKIGHVIMYVKDIRIARAFWEKKVGLKPRFTDRGWVEYALGETSFAIHIWKTGLQAAPKKNGSATEINFQTSNIKKTHQELASRGVQFSQPPTEMPYGWTAQFKDQDGNVYSLFTPRFES